MKKMILIMLSLCFVVGMFAQGMEVPEDPDIDYGILFTTFAGLVAVIPLVVELIKKIYTPVSSLGVQIVSWGVGIVVTMFAWLMNLGFLEGLLWWEALLYALGASLAANGIFDTGIVKWVVDLVTKRNS